MIRIKLHDEKRDSPRIRSGRLRPGVDFKFLCFFSFRNTIVATERVSDKATEFVEKNRKSIFMLLDICERKLSLLSFAGRWLFASLGVRAGEPTISGRIQICDSLLGKTGGTVQCSSQLPPGRKNRSPPFLACFSPSRVSVRPSITDATFCSSECNRTLSCASIVLIFSTLCSCCTSCSCITLLSPATCDCISGRIWPFKNSFFLFFSPEKVIVVPAVYGLSLSVCGFLCW